MPSFSKLGDKAFLSDCQLTDEVIQNDQTIFMFTWIGLIISLLGFILCSIRRINLIVSLLRILSGIIYLLMLQRITMSIHTLTNNKSRKLDLGELTNLTFNEARVTFERRWNFYDQIRNAIVFSLSLLFLLILTMR